MKNLLFILLTLFLTMTVTAQNSTVTPGSLDAGSIESQYDFLVKKSNNYQQYKVVRKDFLTKFYKNIADSLATNNKEISDLNNTSHQVGGRFRENRVEIIHKAESR